MKIALTCSHDNGEEKYFLKKRYIEYILTSANRYRFEVYPVVLPTLAYPDSDADKMRRAAVIFAHEFDGFIFTGGDDIEPSFYGDEKKAFCGDVEVERDKSELALLREVIALDKPVFGICRGIQVINVALGGTLWQDINIEQNLTHAASKLDGIPGHAIRTDGFIRELCGTDEIRVNSYHHQAVKTLGNGLRIAAVSDDGVIEAVESCELSFVKAVQWHPEVNPDALSLALMKHFYEHISKRM